MVDAAAVRVVGCVDCRLDMAGCGATDGTSSEPTESSQRRDDHAARQAMGAVVARTARIESIRECLQEFGGPQLSLTDTKHRVLANIAGGSFARHTRTRGSEFRA